MRVTREEYAYLGIDPGFERVGFGVVSYTTGRLLFYTYLEDWSTHHDYLLSTLKYIKERWNLELVGVEHVHAMRQQGIASTGKFMKATGIIIGTLIGMEIPFIEVTPQKWKTIDPILKPKKEESKSQKKARSLKFVERYYFDSTFCNIKANKKAKIDMADAICIATYLYLNHK